MLYLGADHRGFLLKEKIKNWLASKSIHFTDLGNTHFDKNDDFVDFAKKVAQKVITGKNEKGIVICGSGVGVCIAANKIKGIRCGLVVTSAMTIEARKHDDINVIALPADLITFHRAAKIIDKFLSTRFLSEVKYQRRIDKIKQLENL